MIRMYEYDHSEAYRDFQNYLFSHPYDFVWDWVADKVVIHGIAYRISSLQHINDGGNQVTCLCFCGGGNGGSGTGNSKVKTDESLHGEGSETNPLGVKLSEKADNRLQILDDGCYVGDEPLPYSPPSVVLSSSIEPDEYLKGETLSNMTLTVTVTAGSERIRDVRIYDGTKTIHVFELVAGSHAYVFNLPTGINSDVTFTASISDGMDYLSNMLTYKFVLPVYCGIADEMTVMETEILSETPFKVSGSSFEHIFGTFNGQHLWMCCPENRIIKSIADENGFNITTAFKKTPVKLTLADEQFNYSLYVFDTKTTGNDYSITFNF